MPASSLSIFGVGVVGLSSSLADAAPGSGSHYAIYDGVKSKPGPDCGLYEVGKVVPESCCSDAKAAKVPMVDFFKPDPTMCLAASFLDDGAGVRAFFGCVGGTVTYSENCREPGMPYPFPPGFNKTALTKGPVPTPHDCGCASLIGTGPGCYKANDFSSQGHNKYKKDPRHFYVHIEACESPAPAPSPPPPAAQVGEGSHYAIYDGVKSKPAPECDQYEIGNKVPESCCTAEGTQKLDMNKFFNPDPTMCLAASLFKDGSGVRAFFGCVGESITYAEVCREPGMPYPFPPGFNATKLTRGAVATPEDCACTNLIGVGAGCYKATDPSTNGHNKFKDDPRIFYAMLKPCMGSAAEVVV